MSPSSRTLTMLSAIALQAVSYVLSLFVLGNRGFVLENGDSFGIWEFCFKNNTCVSYHQKYNNQSFVREIEASKVFYILFYVAAFVSLNSLLFCLQTIRDRIQLTAMFASSMGAAFLFVANLLQTTAYQQLNMKGNDGMGVILPWWGIIPEGFAVLLVFIVHFRFSHGEQGNNVQEKLNDKI